jgi:hypothetical protein
MTSLVLVNLGKILPFVDTKEGTRDEVSQS